MTIPTAIWYSISSRIKYTGETFSLPKGYFTSLALMILQLPMILMGIFVNHNITSLPGVFGNLLTIIAITIIYLNNRRVDAYQKELRDQAVTDQMTGLPNRFACARLLKDLIDSGEKFAFVSVDINGFKGINDTMGFDTGNDVLCEIASRWKEIADTGATGTLDFITRIGGDEFVFLIRDFNSDEDIAKTIRQYEAVLQNRQLKRANSSNHILRFSHELLKVERTLELEGKIREALKNETIFFYLQPQFDMQHKLRGFGALARMKDSDGAFISPAEFIPAAEKVGLVDKVDRMVFRKAAVFFGELVRRTGADITLSVNVSVCHLMKNAFSADDLLGKSYNIHKMLLFKFYAFLYDNPIVVISRFPSIAESTQRHISPGTASIKQYRNSGHIPIGSPI